MISGEIENVPQWKATGFGRGYYTDPPIGVRIHNTQICGQFNQADIVKID